MSLHFGKNAEVFLIEHCDDCNLSSVVQEEKTIQIRR